MIYSLNHFGRRVSRRVRIGQTAVGGGEPIAVQSMTSTPTDDVAASVAQILRISAAGGKIVRLTAQGRPQAEALAEIRSKTPAEVALVADIHFTPEVALVAAAAVDKVRINPGNFALAALPPLLEICKKRGVALRIGVNHGSLARRIFDRYGDTPAGMVESAMEFLRACAEADFREVVVSMKSSNTRVMVAAYRLLAERMAAERMDFPLHLGVTEAGDGLDGRVKSAVGIGALLGDGLGDTIRVSLTEAPEHEIPVGQALVRHFQGREGVFEVKYPERYSPYEYRRRSGVTMSLIGEEIPADWRVIEASSANPTAELRAAILDLDDKEPVAVSARYTGTKEEVALAAAADLGVLFLDGLADGLKIVAPLEPADLREIELAILQAARVRFSHTDFIACPGCGRTLYDIQAVLRQIKARVGAQKNLRIGVMGCIVNGPGEMADADYGYVGAAPGHITLYRGREVVERDIPEGEALERLVALIKSDGRWE